MASGDELDLPAATLRANGDELASSVQVLAGSLEQALPGIVTVQWRRVGGFRSKRREVQRIEVPLGDELFELRRDEAVVVCTRHKVVRGITLSRREMTLADWLPALVGALGGRAEISERDRDALEGLLR
jgi:hypothetical protein